MNTESTRASVRAKIWGRPRRIVLAVLGAAVLMSGAALPAHAAPIEAEITVTGWPSAPIHAGEEFTMTINVDNAVLGAPDLAGHLVSLNLNDDIAVIDELDEHGKADVTVRPLATGLLAFTASMAADEHHAAVIGDPMSLQVLPVPTAVELIFPESNAAPVSFGGGEISVIASVKSDCAANAASDADEADCIARYGYPAGDLVLTRDGVEVERFAVPGSGGAALAAPGEDLGEGVNSEETSVFSAYVPVPDILLGSPSSNAYELTFVPSNWFGASATGSDVQLRAASTSVEIYVGDDLFDPQHTVYGDEVTLVAFVTNEDFGGAPLSGTVRFFEDGEPISGELPLVEGIGAAFEWVPTIGTGEYSITAVFTPATLNHEASASERYPLTVVVTPAPNPNVEVEVETDAATGKGEVLAKTGAGSAAAIGAGGLFAAVAGLLLMVGVTAVKRMRRLQG